MPVTYSCNGITKEFPIPDNETFSSVTVAFPNGQKYSFNAHYLLFMENIFTARGCVCFKEILPSGATVTINGTDEETTEQTIERLDEITAEIQQTQQQILAVDHIASEDN